MDLLKILYLFALVLCLFILLPIIILIPFFVFEILDTFFGWIFKRKKFKS